MPLPDKYLGLMLRYLFLRKNSNLNKKRSNIQVAENGRSVEIKLKETRLLFCFKSQEKKIICNLKNKKPAIIWLKIFQLFF